MKSIMLDGREGGSAVRLILRGFRFGVICGILVVCLAGGGSSSVSAAPSGNTALNNALHQDLADYLRTRSSIEHISTLSMTVSFRKAPDINMAVGTTKFGGGAPVTPENLFQIGSDTKSFTAALILQLEAAGVLSINDTVGKWLPQYPAYANATIRQLLNMTSGIPTYDDTDAWGKGIEKDPLEELTLAQLVAYVYPAAATLGAAFAYSNTGYILAQMIIDKASPSHDYQTEIDNLIAKLGLKNTFYEPYFYPSSVTQRLVAGYYTNDVVKPVLMTLLGTDTSAYSLGWTQAAGGMISTPEDVATWVRDLFEGNVLPPKQLAELTSLVAIPSAQPISQTSAQNPQGFGLGVFQITTPAMGLFWAYQGSTIGYRASYAYSPTSGLIICIFTNSQPAPALGTVNTVLITKIYETLKTYGRL